MGREMGDLCRLCGRKESIKNSHIIPEFMYKFVYDAKHRFFPFSTQDFSDARIEQQGYKEPLLCSDCEGKFSKWETAAARELDRIAEETPAASAGEYELYRTVDYQSLKWALLSILWRMGEAKHDAFKYYRLGPYAEPLRQMLHSQTLLSAGSFPIMLSKISDDAAQLNRGILLLFNKIGRLNKMSVQSFVAYGFQFDIFMTHEKFPQQWYVVTLNDTSLLGVHRISMRDLAQGRVIVDFNAECNAHAQKFYGLVEI